MNILWNKCIFFNKSYGCEFYQTDVCCELLLEVVFFKCPVPKCSRVSFRYHPNIDGDMDGPQARRNQRGPMKNQIQLYYSVADLQMTSAGYVIVEYCYFVKCFLLHTQICMQSYSMCCPRTPGACGLEESGI